MIEQILSNAVRTLREPRVRLALSLLALGYLAIRWFLLLTSDSPIFAADSYTYWNAPYDDPYTGPQIGLPGAYLYPPPFLQVLAPLRLLPWELFHALWAAIGFAALVFLVGPIGAALAITFLPFVFRDLLVGNIHLMLGAAIVIGLRYPAVWAFPVLTKITPGVALVWFVGRRDWRGLSIAVGASVLLAIASYFVEAELWGHWIERMRGDSGTAGGGYMLLLLVRFGVAALLTYYAAMTRRPWLLPVAVTISLPILWPDSLAILLACFPLLVGAKRWTISGSALPNPVDESLDDSQSVPGVDGGERCHG
jgi:hypothetical protein